MSLLSRLFDSSGRRAASLAREIVGASHAARLQFLELNKGEEAPGADAELLFAFCIACTHMVDRVAQATMGERATVFVAQVWSEVVAILVAHGTAGQPDGALGSVIRKSMNDSFTVSQAVFWRAEWESGTKLVPGSVQYVLGERVALAVIPKPAPKTINLGAILVVECLNAIRIPDKLPR